MSTSPEITDDPLADDRLGGSGHAGRNRDWTWPLPCDPGCARLARSLLAEAMNELGLPYDAVEDAKLMVSELVTNSYKHAGDHGPFELWLSLRAGGGRTAELVCEVFDGLADVRLPYYSWTSGDCGRGLTVVGQLSRGRWGTRNTGSRLDVKRTGKTVWFALPA